MSLDQFMQGLYRRFYWVIVFALVGAVAAAFYLNYNSRAVARVKVAVIEPALTRATKSALQAQVTFDSVVQSQLLAQRVIDRLGLEGITAFDLSQEVTANLAPTLIPNVITPLYIVEVKYKDEAVVQELANAFVEEGRALFLELNSLDVDEYRRTYEQQLAKAKADYDEAMANYQAFRQANFVYDLKEQIAFQTGILQQLVDKQRSELSAQIYNAATDSAQSTLLGELRTRQEEAAALLEELGIKAADYDALAFELSLAEQLLQKVTSTQTGVALGEALSNYSNNDSTPPSALANTGQLTSPAPNSEVSGVVSIRGTSVDPRFAKYEVHVTASVDSGNWVSLGVFNASVTDGELATWDTMLFPDGAYTVRLRVVRQDANYSEYYLQPLFVDNAGDGVPGGVPGDLLVSSPVVAAAAPAAGPLGTEAPAGTGPVLEQALAAVDQAQANLLQYQITNDATAIGSRVGAAANLVNSLQQAEWSALREVEQTKAERDSRNAVLLEVSGQIESERQRLTELITLQPEHDELQARLQLAQNSYLQLDSEVRQLVLDETLPASEQVKLVDPATLIPQTFSQAAIMVVAVLTGVVFGLLLVYMLAYFDRTVRDANEAGELMGTRALATIPHG